MTNLLLSERDGDVLILTLNRPDALNALSLALEAEISAAFREVAPDVRVIVLTGAGRAFTAGVDLKELEEVGTEARDWLGPESLFEIVRASPVPVIAAVNGFAITGGLELALMADFILAGESAKFADTHARVGLTPSWGCTQLLSRRIGIARAKQMSLTGQFIDGQTACDWGLANEVVADDGLRARAVALAQDIASTHAPTVAKIRGLIERGAGVALERGLALEAEIFAEHIKTLTREAVAERRGGVQARGRAQSGG